MDLIYTQYRTINNMNDRLENDFRDRRKGWDKSTSYFPDYRPITDWLIINFKFWIRVWVLLLRLWSSTYTAVGTVGTVGAISYYNKPDELMLQKLLKNKLSAPDRNLGALGNVAKLVGGTIIAKSVSTKTEDYVFFRLGTATTPNGEQIRYIGIVNNWFEM